MRVVATEEQELARKVICEVHNKECELSSRFERCPCCGKRVCLCNYVL